MQVFEAILFDVDGTLLDTSEFIFQAFEYSLERAGFPKKSREEMSRLVGKPLDLCYEILTGVADVTELSAMHRAFQVEHIDLAQAYPGTRETLETLKESGLRIGAVTTRARASTLKTLSFTGLATYLDHVVAFEDVENLKPHPEPILKTLGVLNSRPAAAVMVGDTDVDIAAGRNAGTLTVGVTYGFHGLEILKSCPDHIIDDIAAILPLVLPLFEHQR
ncbi:MAG: HAD-IA family hydrolase [Candidatus Aquicultor sp.]|nr:HAD-IA family hydrolase [Candidatus Aquicultor sp.]